MSARSTASSTTKHASTATAGAGLLAPLAGLKEDLLKPGKRPAMRAGAAFAAYMTVLFASIALWWALANVMDQAWAALIVAAVWAVVCALFHLAGKRPPGRPAARG
jgi:hypothetical protein